MRLGRPSCRCGGAGCNRCADIEAQAEDWLLAKCPPSVSGQGGHDAAFRAACCAVKGFDLTPEAAMRPMAAWNALCQPAWSEAELWHKVRSANGAKDDQARGYLRWEGRGGGDLSRRAGEPAVDVVEARRAWAAANGARAHGGAEPLDRPTLAAVVEGSPMGAHGVDWRFLRSRSPVDPAGVTRPEEFLAAVFEPGEKVMIFTRYKSQGQFVFWRRGDGASASGDWCVALAEKRQERGRRVAGLPNGMEPENREGVWFLNQPVTGEWSENPRTKKWSRRSEEAVTAWRYFVLESDEEGIEAQWLALLALLPLAIVALYTSGGRSVHALIRVDAPSKAVWDRFCKDVLKRPLTLLGADKGVFSAVRLTRLPCCWRRGRYDENGSWRPYLGKDGKPAPRRQELLFLNPGAQTGVSIMDLKPVRVVPLDEASTGQ